MSFGNLVNVTTSFQKKIVINMVRGAQEDRLITKSIKNEGGHGAGGVWLRFCQFLRPHERISCDLQRFSRPHLFFILLYIYIFIVGY